MIFRTSPAAPVVSIEKAACDRYGPSFRVVLWIVQLTCYPDDLS
jgi:hypothetical protein